MAGLKKRVTISESRKERINEVRFIVAFPRYSRIYAAFFGQYNLEVLHMLLVHD